MIESAVGGEQYGMQSTDVTRYTRAAGAALRHFFAGRHEDDETQAAELVDELEDLGPTFVKFGQLLATRPDLLPPAYVEALSRLNHRAEPMPVDEAIAMFEAEIGIGVDVAFDSFEERPIGAASLAQVHRAVLRDGRTVAVKIQRPDIEDVIDADLAVLRKLAAAASAAPGTRVFDLANLVDHVEEVLRRELDFQREAQQLQRMSELVADVDDVVVPEPVPDFSSRRVITMTYLAGAPLDQVHGSVLTDVDGERLADELFGAYLRQIFVEGFVHVDPHPGNVLLTRDGRLGMVDLGMVTELSPSMRRDLLRMVLAAADGRADEAATVAIELAQPLEGFDEAGFRREVAKLVGWFVQARGEELEAGPLMIGITRAAAEHRLRPPNELAILGRTLSALDAVGRVLSPGFNSRDAIVRRAPQLMSERSMAEMSPQTLMRTALDLEELVKEAPGHAHRVLESLAAGQFRINVAADESQNWRDTFASMTNRLTMGLILAALIVGAAILTTVDAGPDLVGYPALAVIVFFAAALAGSALLVATWVDGRRDHRRTH